MSTNHNITIETMPPLKHPIKREPLGSFIETMQGTGFHTWGFVIYRCTYSDNALFTKYIEEMKRQILQDLQEIGKADLLEQYLKYTMIEEPTLAGASKHEIRERFRQWVADRSTERDGEGFDHPFTKGLFPDLNPIFNQEHPIPRFHYCISIDDRCLETFQIYTAWCEAGRIGLRPLVACVLIDLSCPPEGTGEKGFPNIEGCTKSHLGWMYLSVDCIPEIYNTLTLVAMSDPYVGYIRPPGIHPRDPVQEAAIRNNQRNA